MLVIRNEQMEILHAHRVKSFADRLRQHLATTSVIQAQAWTSERIEAEVALAIESATRFHLTREVDVARLAEIFCTRLGGFNGQPISFEGMNILYAYGVEPDSKLDRFEAFVNAQPRGSS